MKFALVDEHRLEARPGLSGKCPNCSSAMVAKCGSLRRWHWAHRGVLQCDHWWENETEWHRNWKNMFPTDWQEVIHRAENGDKHIADVKTAHGLVIEFQHSHLNPKERRSREAFYRSMIWVVNGLRRVRDKPSFYAALPGRQLIGKELLSYLVFSDRCALLRDWSGGGVGVFFDFGIALETIDQINVPVLWHLSAKSPSGYALLTPVPVEDFVAALRDGRNFKGITAKVVARMIRVPKGVPPWPYSRRPRRVFGWAQYQARQRRMRSQQRF